MATNWTAMALVITVCSLVFGLAAWLGRIFGTERVYVTTDCRSLVARAEVCAVSVPDSDAECTSRII